LPRLVPVYVASHVAELFLPLGQEDIDDTMRDFIKSEVTRELNLKICDLYQDEELSIIDKVRALLHHIARALRNFTPAPCGSPKSPPLCLTLFILCRRPLLSCDRVPCRTRSTARWRPTCAPTSCGAPWRTRATRCSSSSRTTRPSRGDTPTHPREEVGPSRGGQRGWLPLRLCARSCCCQSASATAATARCRPQDEITRKQHFHTPHLFTYP